MDLKEELDALRVANEHIARGLTLIEEQEERIRKLELNGQDATEATRLLLEMQASMEAMVVHRAVIEEIVAMIRLCLS